MAEQTETQPWFMLSISQGNLIQIGGLGCSLGLLGWAPRAPAAYRAGLLLISWFISYFCNHAIAHWAAGRLCGVRFVGYGVHGTTSPRWYPLGMRWIFRHIPFLSARLDRVSLREVGPSKRFWMYLSAPVSTLLTGLFIPTYGRWKKIPGSRELLIGAILWFTPMMIVESLRSGGDLHRAWRELRRSYRGNITGS